MKSAQININEIPGGGGAAGMMTAVGIIVIVLIGIPAASWFLGASLALGAAGALAVKCIARP